MRRQRSTVLRQAMVISDSTLMRARMSSERLVSCVEVPSISCGQCFARYLRIGVEGAHAGAVCVRLAAYLVERGRAG